MKVSIDSTVLNLITKDLNLTEDDQAKIRYSLQMIIGDTSKLIIMFLLFLIFNQQMNYLMALLALSVIRLYTGGLHFKTYYGCLLFSLGFFSTSLYLADHLMLPDVSLLAIGSLSLIIITCLSPITSKNRPHYSDSKRRQFRMIGCSVVLLHLIGFMATKNNPYFTLSIWVIFLQAIQLILAKGVEHREKEISV